MSFTYTMQKRQYVFSIFSFCDICTSFFSLESSLTRKKKLKSFAKTLFFMSCFYELVPFSSLSMPIKEFKTNYKNATYILDKSVENEIMRST